MAGIAVSFAVKMLEEVIGGAALNEITHLRGVRDDVKWLHMELEWLKSFLLDVEQRSLSGDEIAKMWVREVTDTAYRAEDVAATLAARRFTTGDQPSDSRSTGFWSFVPNFGSYSWITSTGDGVGSPAKRRYVPIISHLKQLHEIGNDLKELKKEIEEIQQTRERYGFINSNVESSSRENLIREMRRMSLFQNKEDVFGLENDKRKVMDLLHSDKSGNYVIGIVGMGGMGKTTLARQVIKSIDRSQFPNLAWVDLSQNYIQNHSIHKLLYEIAKQVMPDSPDLQSKGTDELSELVKTELKDKRNLIVMDDMWETDVWDLVKDHLPDRKNGSRIIITTRNENVAEHPALHFPPHRMKGLNNMQSWNLFTHLVFEDAERECTGQLKKLAEELVGGCGGSPLALTVLGGLLAGKEKTHSAWRKVVGYRSWLRGEAGKNCLDILRLSYMDLPHHLKMCFLYLSAFPEDHEIDVDKLIRLWVAEGFVAKTGSNDEETEEDIARTYLEALKQRCLVRVFESPPSVYNKDLYEYCRIHDLIRELIIGEAKEANFMNSEINDGSNRAIHRLSLQGEISSSTLLRLDDTSPSLRTLLNFAKVRITNFKHFNLLRVLDLERAEIDKLPEEVGDMILLRYLSIKDTRCKSLPYTISRLSYLETLDCQNIFSHFSVEIPDDVWKMKTLKHILGVNVEGQVGISHLVKLQTLVGWVATPDFVHSLSYLTHLRVLSLDCTGTIPLPMDIWKAMGSWPFLKFLRLSGFDMKDVVCDKHGFPRLQRLIMVGVDFDSWEVERGSMLSLESITIYYCKGLKRLPNGLAHCKMLRGIYCYGMDDEFEEWYYRSKKEFQHVQFIWGSPESESAGRLARFPEKNGCSSVEITPLTAEVAVAFVLLKLSQVLGETLIENPEEINVLYEDIEWLHKELMRRQFFLMFANKNIWLGEKSKIWPAHIRDVAIKAGTIAAKFAFLRDTEWQHDSSIKSKSGTEDGESLKNFPIFNQPLLHAIEMEIEEVKSMISNTGYPSSDLGKGTTLTGHEVGVEGKREEFGADMEVTTCVNVHETVDDTERTKENVEKIWIKDHSSTTEGRKSDTLIQEDAIYAIKETIIDFTKARKALTDVLCMDERRLYVVGVVGMGGVGKTALAAQVFQSSDVQKLFPICVWVDLSQNYIQRHRGPGGLRSLLLRIAKEVNRQMSTPIFSLLFQFAEWLTHRKTMDLERLSTDELIELIRMSLKGKRYLIVMDDMWEEEVWDLIEAHLPDESNKSRIMITTRNENVARRPAFHFPPYRLQCLDGKQSWDFFTKSIFENEGLNRKRNFSFMKLAREAVEKCGGSPLALDILVKCLAVKNKTREAWKSALENEEWKKQWQLCMETIKLSYTCLPNHLKWCFLYLSAFPEDSKIEVERLIKLWVAEGFVRTEDHDNYDDDKVTREDIAETYLEDLKQRCLVIVEDERQASEFVSYCSIHTLLREISIKEAEETGFMYGLAYRSISEKSKMLIELGEVVWLRVLDLQRMDIGDLPEQVGDMTQLRYLNVRSSRCKLPDSIGRLSKLETLDCRVEAGEPITIPDYVWTGEPITIPDNVWKIPTLRHVHGNGLRCNSDVSHLVKLQTVGSLLLNSWIQESIPNLICLRKADIYIEPEHKDEGDMINDSWKCLQTLPYLKVLIFNLNGYENIDMTCSKQGFPSLLRLTLVNCVFKSWTVEEGSMPYLEILQLESCPNIKRLPSDLVNRTTIPRLFFTKMGENFNQWVKSCNVWDAVTISGTYSLNVKSPTLGAASNIDEGIRDVKEKAPPEIKEIRVEPKQTVEKESSVTVAVIISATATWIADLRPKLAEISERLDEGFSDTTSLVQWADSTVHIIGGIMHDARSGYPISWVVESLFYELESIQREGERIAKKYRREFGETSGEMWFYSFLKPISLFFIRDDVNNMKRRLDDVMESAKRLDDAFYDLRYWGNCQRYELE